MIRISTVLLSILLAGPVLGQSYKDSLQAQFMRYTNLLVTKQFGASADFINPNFFKLVPKAQLITLIEKTYNNPAIQFSIENPQVISVGDIQEFGGERYVKLQYSNIMKMHFNAAEGKVQDTAATKAALMKQFGQSHVTYHASTDIYEIFVTKNVIANSRDNQHWTFVVVEERQKSLLEKFIPKELL